MGQGCVYVEGLSCICGLMFYDDDDEGDDGLNDIRSLNI